MAFRLTRTESRDLARHAEALETGYEAVQTAFDALLEQLREAVSTFNREVVVPYNETVEAAGEFLAEVHGRLEDEYDDKSDRWRDSDAGSEAASMVNEWDISLDALDLVEIIEPELSAGSQADVIRELPEESM